MKSVLVIIVGTTLLFSCSIESATTEPEKIREDWHKVSAIEFAVKNEIPIPSVDKHLGQTGLSKDFITSTASYSLHFLSSEIVQIFQSKSQANVQLVVKTNLDGHAFHYFVKTSGDVLTFYKETTPLMNFDIKKGKKVKAEISSKTSGDCNELGPARPGEDFGACFERNWNNYCCDFAGCASQIVSPTYVAIAISAVCGYSFCC